MRKSQETERGAVVAVCCVRFAPMKRCSLAVRFALDAQMLLIPVIELRRVL
jgi:hypothetical protein